MDLSSSHIHINPNAPNDAFPNILRFYYDHLRFDHSHKIVKRELATCRSCRSVLVESWKCEICQNKNEPNRSINGPFLAVSNNVQYVINDGYDESASRYVVFCIDISGSMGETVLVSEKYYLFYLINRNIWN